MTREVLFIEGPLDGKTQTIPDALSIVDSFDDFTKNEVIYKIIAINALLPFTDSSEPRPSRNFYFGVLEGTCGYDVLKLLVNHYIKSDE